MCGIVGIVGGGAGSSGDAQAAVDRMLRAMRHRGPDGSGTLAFAGGAAGMVRLALVDLSERGQQPIWSADGQVAILFNGEMYSFRAERERLEKAGVSFRSATDTEVVLALYLERGPEFVHALRGMYALAIFDWRETGRASTPRIVLARDPMGIKPLYVVEEAGGFVFASELRALLASGRAAPAIDREGLADYLAHGFVIQPRTILRGVRMVEPGTLEVYDPGRAPRRVRSYHLPPYEPREETLDQAAARLRAVLEESVALHAFADAKVGAFLSGGIDSTGIVGLMRRHVGDLRTYTLRFVDVPGLALDEAAEAEAAAARFGCLNTIVDVSPSEVRVALPGFAGSLDQPSTDGLNTWLVSRAAARDVKGVLSGLGGDEFFSGYPVTARMARQTGSLRGRAESLAGHLAAALGPRLPEGRLRVRVDNLAARRSPVATWLHGHTVFPARVARRLAGLDGLVPDVPPGVRAALDGAELESSIGLSALLDARIYMGSQLLRDSDATSMAHSLELRVPLVDVEVARFSRSCADDFKLAVDGGSSAVYRDSGAKRVLVEALRDVLPEGVASRPKRGFALPFDHWMRGALHPWVQDACSADAIERRGWVDPALVRPLLDGSRARPYPRLWALLILELWARAVVDPVSAAR